jgi:hypothetical protein
VEHNKLRCSYGDSSNEAKLEKSNLKQKHKQIFNPHQPTQSNGLSHCHIPSANRPAADTPIYIYNPHSPYHPLWRRTQCHVSGFPPEQAHSHDRTPVPRHISPHPGREKWCNLRLVCSGNDFGFLLPCRQNHRPEFRRVDPGSIVTLDDCFLPRLHWLGLFCCMGSLLHSHRCGRCIYDLGPIALSLDSLARLWLAACLPGLFGCMLSLLSRSGYRSCRILGLGSIGPS